MSGETFFTPSQITNISNMMYQDGIKQERKRIIKLLEGELQPATDENELENYIINSLIALIEGEKRND